MSSGHSSSSSTTLKTSPLPCRCTTSRHVPSDKVVRTRSGLKLQALIVAALSPGFCVNARRLCIFPLDEFARAVYVATGLKLTRHLVNTIFKIFDVDHDDQLSYKEFIGIMKDRLHRGARVRSVQLPEKMHLITESTNILVKSVSINKNYEKMADVFLLEIYTFIYSSGLVFIVFTGAFYTDLR